MDAMDEFDLLILIEILNRSTILSFARAKF
jgi:hypothetical protein